MNLFEQAMERNMARTAPLAMRMRPITLDDFEEQYGIVGRGSLLRRSIEADKLMSAIFYGPPGTGKTTLAKIIARMTSARFVTINAVMAGVADIKKVIKEAKESRTLCDEKTILFVDEIHRFNRVQQDALLPFVESGLITMIGSTTENPMFSVIRPLLSRSNVYRFEPLSRDAIRRIMEKALTDKGKGLGECQVVADMDALDHLANVANGDARTALNALEMAVMTTPSGVDGHCRITLAVAEEAIQERVLKYDREDEHFDVISAFIKSMRGSDPQATLYWLARMLYAGEDPAFISRRIMIQAAEDVGLADSQALVVAAAAAQAVERIGMPEARIVLAEAALYVATAPKSNSVLKGIDAAFAAVKKEQAEPVPAHLRGTGYGGAQTLGHGAGYKYPHDYPGNYTAQSYLPANIEGKVFYEPSAGGQESEIKNRLAQWEKQHPGKNLS